MSRDLMITCRRVAKSFRLQRQPQKWRLTLRPDRTPRRFEALKDITIDVPRGEFVGILGRNGAGKSTLLRTMGGVYAPDRGVVSINGEMSAIYEMGIAGNDLLTGHGFARRWFDLFSRPGERRRTLIDDVRDFSELEDAFDRPIRTYSAGQKARLSFALATARQSDIYIIDEVLSVGDEYFQNKCWRRIRQRLSGGSAGIIATHDWSAILRLCPTSYIIDKGRTVAHGPSAHMVKQYLQLSGEDFAKGARFDASLPMMVNARSLEDFEMPVLIDADERIDMLFGAAIEVFVPSFGWEHLLHLDPQPIGQGPGRIEVGLKIPRLPLKGGSYALSLFLNKRAPAGEMVGLDVRSWTVNEAVTLDVDGPSSSGVLSMPLAVRDFAAHG